MDSIIKDQLSKITTVDLTYDDNITTLYIPKTTELSLRSLKQGYIYLIEILDSVHDIKNVLLMGNKLPKNKYYNIEFIKETNGLYMVNGVAIDDPTDAFYGWLPKQCFRILSKE